MLPDDDLNPDVPDRGCSAGDVPVDELTRPPTPAQRLAIALGTVPPSAAAVELSAGTAEA